MSSPSPAAASPNVTATMSARAQLAQAKLNVVGQPSKFQALRAMGWIQPYDYILATIIFMTWVVLGFWCIFGQPTAIKLIGFVLVDIFIAQLWIVSLVFRCSCFVLETQADINLMPEAAARIAVAYLKGQAPSSK